MSVRVSNKRGKTSLRRILQHQFSLLFWKKNFQSEGQNKYFFWGISLLLAHTTPLKRSKKSISRVSCIPIYSSSPRSRSRKKKQPVSRAQYGSEKERGDSLWKNQAEIAWLVVKNRAPQHLLMRLSIIGRNYRCDYTCYWCWYTCLFNDESACDSHCEASQLAKNALWLFRDYFRHVWEM